MDQNSLETEVLGVRDVLADAGRGDLSVEKFDDIASAVYATDSGHSELREAVEEWDTFAKSFTGSNLLLGYCRSLLGDLQGAEEILRKEKRHEWGFYWLIKVTLGLGRLADAASLAEDARERYPDSLPLRFLAADVFCQVGRTDEAGKLLEKSPDKESPEYCFHQGLYQEKTGAYPEAIDWYRKATDLEPDHSEGCFRLGYLLDIYGEGDATEEAIEAYERCVKLTPVHTNAVINLAILYEDRERYHDAIKCFETVLRYFPEHRRARLFLKDAEASTRMFYDKEQEKKADRQSQVLKIPVSDFELSVRSRNCLQKMNIETLGDLILKTEQELLSYKNFGETSLKEIKDMLGQKGLRLGQALEDRSGAFSSSRNPLEATVSPEVLDRPIETLNLSIRSRRCMERLEVKTIRDLINKTEVELDVGEELRHDLPQRDQEEADGARARPEVVTGGGDPPWSTTSMGSSSRSARPGRWWRRAAWASSSASPSPRTRR